MDQGNYNLMEVVILNLGDAGQKSGQEILDDQEYRRALMKELL